MEKKEIESLLYFYYYSYQTPHINIHNPNAQISFISLSSSLHLCIYEYISISYTKPIFSLPQLHRLFLSRSFSIVSCLFSVAFFFICKTQRSMRLYVAHIPLLSFGI